MNLITKSTKQKKNCAKNGAVNPQSCRPAIPDPDQWVKDLLVQESLHEELMATTDPQRYKQLQQQIQAMIDADGDHD